MDDNQSATSLEDLFHGLQEEVATLVADVHDLALYTKLNITGFLKILKVRSFLPLAVRPLTFISIETRCAFPGFPYVSSFIITARK
jgi:hypothetical protein